MDAITPVWANAEHSLVRLLQDGVEHIIPADPENRDFAALLEAGTEIGSYVAPPLPVPDGVLRHQGLIALLGSGITEQVVRDRIAEIEDTAARELARLRFDQPEWRRGGPFLAWLADAFSLSQKDVDALLIAAWIS